MRDIPNTKPLPARPAAPEPPPAPIKPTPARELSGSDGREGAAPEAPAREAPGTEPDIDEAALEAEGGPWTVRVLGRSGRAGERSPPLLLLGFWSHDGGARPNDAGRGEHQREAIVVGRRLADLTPDRLEEALRRSTSPPRDDRRKPFFDAASQGRRGGSPQRDS